MYITNLLPLLLSLPLVLSWSDKRFAKFYNEKDCKGDHGIRVNMENKGCLRQNGRQSVSLGGDLAKGGAFCRVWYKDGDCNCIEGSQLYYKWPEMGDEPCDNDHVEGIGSFHFEKIGDFSIGCPTSGCYGKVQNPVMRTKYNNEGNPDGEYVSGD